MNLSISGTITPDATIADTGAEAGTWNGRSYWAWNAGGYDWYLFWYTIKTTKWVISNVLGTLSVSVGYWNGPNAESPVGDYTPGFGSGASGTATVAEVAADNTPDTFDFSDVADADLSTAYVSDSQGITGMDAGTAISITGGEYRINGGDWTSDAGTIDPGDTLELRQTSSADPETTTTATVTVGTLAVGWDVTTAAAVSVITTLFGPTLVESRIIGSRIVRGIV